jgi:hypothetical protein
MLLKGVEMCVDVFILKSQHAGYSLKQKAVYLICDWAWGQRERKEADDIVIISNYYCQFIFDKQ